VSRRPVVAFAGGPPRLNQHIAAQLLAAGYDLEGEPTVVLHSVDGPFAADAPEGVTALSVGEEAVDVQRPFTPRELVRILDERLGAAWRGGTTPMGDTDNPAEVLTRPSLPQVRTEDSSPGLARRIAESVPTWAALSSEKRLVAVEASLARWLADGDDG
jgi:hypothetical protein